jgi:hypothetical protein
MAMIAPTADLVLSLRRILSIEPILFPTIISPTVAAALASELPISGNNAVYEAD